MNTRIISGAERSEKLFVYKLLNKVKIADIRLRANSLIACLILSSIFLACEEDEGTVLTDPEPQLETGLVCPEGQLSGDLVTKTIGAVGGYISTEDNRISIEVPAGAFETDQPITIQPITNTNPSGIGLSYRITPHNITFKKPVKITLSYQEDDITNTLEDALLLAYQDEKGVWKAIGGAEVDKANQKITIKSSHFSDWSLFEALTIEPWSTTIAPSESIELKVFRFINPDEGGFGIPMLGEGSEKAVIGRKAIDASLIEKWSLGGPGVLESEGNLATYFAPGAIPVINPVAVSAKIVSPYNNALILVSNIMIASEGITFRINDGEWMHAVVPTAGFGEGLNLINGAHVADGQTLGSVTIVWRGSGNDIVYPWTVEMPQFKYVKGDLQYHHFFVTPGAAIPSPGALHITNYGKIGEYFTGTFILDEAGMLVINTQGDSWLGKAKIEGYFKVKRTF